MVLNRYGTFVSCIFLLFLMQGCTLSPNYAPVEEGAGYTSKNYGVSGSSNEYKVKPGDTLYSVAWGFGMDYRALASINHIEPPYKIHPGQRIFTQQNTQPQAIEQMPIQEIEHVPVHEVEPVQIKVDAVEPKQQVVQNTTIEKRPAVASSIKEAKLDKESKVLAVKIRTEKGTKIEVSTHPIVSEVAAKSTRGAWYWPAHGRIVQHYAPAMRSKGIDIGGHPNAAIFATRDGEIVYSGSGLRGYGKLIIIKHSADYLSAYAHNKKVLVKEGQMVKAGQKIAEMGGEGGNAKLHFEIRRAGTPVNPLNYLHGDENDKT